MPTSFSSSIHRTPSHSRFPFACGLFLLLLGATPTGNAEPPASVEQDDAQADSLTATKPPARRVGIATSALLSTQVDGSTASPSLPMLGATTSLSWQRYLDSFKHPIPESFAHKIDGSGGK